MKMTITEDRQQAVDEMYPEGTPEYLRILSKYKIQIHAARRLGEPVWNNITVSDLIDYFSDEVGSMSGGRTFAGIFGDWRPINALAAECFSVFKAINPKAITKEMEKRVGLIE